MVETQNQGRTRKGLASPGRKVRENEDECFRTPVHKREVRADKGARNEAVTTGRKRGGRKGAGERYDSELGINLRDLPTSVARRLATPGSDMKSALKLIMGQNNVVGEGSGKIDLERLLRHYSEVYFEGRLSGVRVVWSQRMTR